MITIDKLKANFYPVESLGESYVRCADELPQKIFYSYFKLCGEQGATPFVVSEDLIDDEFAAFVLAEAGCRSVETLTKAELGQNRFGFSHVLYAPHQYHSELKGRLDAERPHTTLCIPIFEPEFSGTETIEDVYALRRSVVDTRRWDRAPAPKIALRFENGATQSGTGDVSVFVKFDFLMREIDNLDGVTDGFIEITNFRDRIVELRYRESGAFDWIRDRDESNPMRVAKAGLREDLWAFLTR